MTARIVAWPPPPPVLNPGEFVANLEPQAQVPGAYPFQSTVAAYMSAITQGGLATGFGTVASGLVGSGTTLANGTPLSGSLNVIGTSVSGASGFTVVAPVVGVMTVLNLSASGALVFPPSGGTFNALSQNASILLASGTSALKIQQQPGTAQYLAWF